MTEVTSDFYLSLQLLCNSVRYKLSFVEHFDCDKEFWSLFSSKVYMTKFALTKGFSDFKIVNFPLKRIELTVWMLLRLEKVLIWQSCILNRLNLIRNNLNWSFSIENNVGLKQIYVYILFYALVFILKFDRWDVLISEWITDLALLFKKSVALGLLNCLALTNFELALRVWNVVIKWLRKIIIFLLCRGPLHHILRLFKSNGFVWAFRGAGWPKIWTLHRWSVLRGIVCWQGDKFEGLHNHS